MSSHDRLRIGLAKACQNWRAFAHVMQVHENYYIKRAGVAGIRARAQCRYLKYITGNEDVEMVVSFMRM